MKTLPDYYAKKNHPSFKRIYYADAMGRISWNTWDGFHSGKAARVYWWMLSRKNVLAFLDCGLDGQLSNAHLTREKEPEELRHHIDQAEREYDQEELECGSAGAEFNWLMTNFGRG